MRGTFAAMAVAVVAYAGIAVRPLAAAPAASDTLRITFIQHAAFSITDGVTTLFVDFPYRPGAQGVPGYDLDRWRPLGVTGCLITHGHYDHFDVTRYLRTPWSLLAPPKLAYGLSRTGHDVIPVAPDEPVTFEGITVEAFATPHDEMEHQSYLVTWHGVRIYVAGDATVTGPLDTVGPVDVVLLNARLAADLAAAHRRPDARVVIVCHRRTGARTGVPAGAVVAHPGQTWRVGARADAR